MSTELHKAKLQLKEIEKQANMARKRAKELETIENNVRSVVESMSKDLGYDIDAKGRMKKPKAMDKAEKKKQYREQCEKPMPARRHRGKDLKKGDKSKPEYERTTPKPLEEMEKVFKATDDERAAIEAKALAEARGEAR